MALLSEIMSDIELRVTAARPNDDMRFEKTQARFVLDYVTAYFIMQRARQARADSFMLDYEYDSTLWQEYELDVVTVNGQKQAILPETPIALPGNFGVQSVYVRDSFGTPRLYRKGTPSMASIQASLPWGRPMFVRVNTKLYLYGIGATKKIYAIIIGGGGQNEVDADGNLIDIQYPAPADALVEIINMVTQILLGEMALPDDTKNDAKDQAVKGK